MSTGDKNSTPAEYAAFTAEINALLEQAEVLKILNGLHDQAKKNVAKFFAAGDKKAVKNAQGVELGSVSMTSPNKRAVCTDDAILMAMADDRGMEIIDGLPTDPEALQQCINIIYEHAPELLVQSISKEDRQELEGDVLRRWQVTGEVPTGWVIKDASTPRFTVAPARTALAKEALRYQVAPIARKIGLEIEKGEK